MTLGKNIKMIRKARGLKQIELARLADMSVSYLSEIENDRTAPSLRTLLKITRALHVDISLIVDQKKPW